MKRWGRSITDPKAWGGILTEAMDMIALCALFLTNEIASWAFMGAAALLSVRFVFRSRLHGKRLNAAWMIAGFLLLGIFGAWLTTRMRFAPVIAAAHVVPLTLTLLPLARPVHAAWGWRLALGFMGVLLASTLSPEFSVTLLVISFIACTTIALRCRHLANEFEKRGTAGSLPQGFIRSGLSQSVILLLAALLIFPLIPRMQGRSTAGGFSGDPATTGYNEEVNLSEWARLGSGGGGATVLRIYGPNGEDPAPMIPAGLLRSRVLGELTPSRWSPSPVRMDSSPLPSRPASEHTVSLDFSRESLETPSLPVPYGTRDVHVETQRYRWRAGKTRVQEWRESRSKNQRLNYKVDVDLGNTFKPNDPPTDSDLFVPENYRTPRIEELAQSLNTVPTLSTTVGSGGKSPLTKIRAIQDFFRRENFKAAYSDEMESQAKTDADRALSPIERFLFVEKQGHCELFASSFAILLRLNGVPSRLVAGFRFSRNSFGDVLIIRQSDAHAWVEAYLPNEGWTAIDPTPRLLHTTGFQDWIRDGYDWFNAKWVRYIVNFGEDEVPIGESARSLGRLAREAVQGNVGNATETELYVFSVLFILFSFFTALGAVLVFRKLGKRRPRKDRLPAFTRRLIQERKRFDRIVSTNSNRKQRIKPLDPRKVEQWRLDYERLRFGPQLPEERRNELFGKLMESMKELSEKEPS